MKSAAATPFLSNETYLFVYGSLRSDMNHPMHQVLLRYAEPVGTGTFQGKLYDLGSYPGAIISKRKSDLIRGEVYRLKDPLAVFKILDRYEGKNFRREIVAISVDRTGFVRCWVYLYTGTVSGHKIIASGNYVNNRD